MYRESEKRDHVNMAQFERSCTRNKLRTSVKQIIPSQVSTRMATNTTVILAIFMTVVTSVTVGRLHGKLNILVLLISFMRAPLKTALASWAPSINIIIIIIIIFLLFQGHVTGSSFNSILSRMFMFLHSTWGGESFQCGFMERPICGNQASMSLALKIVSWH